MSKPITWEEQKSVLLEGLDEGSKAYSVTEKLLENYNGRKAKDNQFKQLDETASADSTATADVARYDKLMMPLIRRVTPALMAMELVGTQPMSAPVGMARTLRFRYGETVASGGPTVDDEASGVNIYDKYSLIAKGEAYTASDARTEAQITDALEGQGGSAMTLDIVKQTITAKSRKLEAKWSVEADEDARALDGIDVESEMVAALSDEILRELDRELIAELDSLAGTTKAFDFANADGRYAGEKFTALTIGFSDLSNNIAVKTKRGGASWMVVHPDLLVALRNSANGAFVPATASADMSPRESLFVGTLNGTIKVYVDVHAVTKTAIMGYKGNNELDVGFVYAPYIPVQSSGIVTNPTTYDPQLSLRTRYAFAKFTDTNTSLGNSADFYAKGTISNLSLGF